MNDSLAAPTIDMNPAENIIDGIVDRAKVDRNGVFWRLGGAYRRTGVKSLEVSLGYGNAGILLSLLEYYRISEDESIAELIHKGKAWIDHALGEAKHGPGFYTGVGGLWYLEAKMASIFPGVGGDLRGRVLDTMRTVETSPGSGASLAGGLAGVLVGALAVLDPDVAAAAIGPFVETLAGCAYFSPTGVFWGIVPHAVQPPISLLNGNAGVDYALALAKKTGNVACSALLAGSLRHADAAYHEAMVNWPDYEEARDLKAKTDADVQKVILEMDSRRPSDCDRVGDSVGWGTGCSGILMSRAAVADAYRESSAIRDLCLRDCRRALERLARLSDRDLGELDGSLQRGRGGLVLSLAAYLSTDTAQSVPVPEGLETRIQDRVGKAGEAVSSDDLSLLSGSAGQAYASLLLEAGRGADSCLHPGRSLLDLAGRETAREAKYGQLMARRLPRTAALAGFNLDTEVISLSSIEKNVGALDPAASAERSRRAAAHEIGLYRQLSEIESFRYLLYRELRQRMLFEQCYSEGMDDTVLSARFQISDSVIPLNLPFDPHGKIDDDAADVTTFLVRRLASSGVIEVKVSALGYHLLDQFSQPAQAVAAIAKVIPRINAAGVSQKQLAELSLKSIRSFIASGFIVPVRERIVGATLSRWRARRMTKRLFAA